MTQRLPIPGQDDGTWGDILNGFLEVSLNADGTLQTAALNQAGGITTSGGLAVTGTPSVSNFLRGDGTWAVPSSAPVSSVFTRTGAVTAQSGDYTASQVTGAMATSVYDAAGIDQQVVGTTATQTLTNKNLNSGTNTFPTLNQNTTGNAATATTATAANGINSATTTVVVNGATAPSTGQVLTASSSTSATWQTPGLSGVGYVSGDRILVPQVSGGPQAYAPTIGQLTAIPYIIPGGSVSLKKLGYGTNGATFTGASMVLGVYNDNADYPGTLISSVTLSTGNYNTFEGAMGTADTGPWPARRWFVMLPLGTAFGQIAGSFNSQVLAGMSGIMNLSNSATPWLACLLSVLTNYSSLPNTFPSGATVEVANGTGANTPWIFGGF